MFSEALGIFDSLKLLYVKNDVAATRQEAFRADRHFSNALNDPFNAIIPYAQNLPHAKNGVAAARQEAFRADRHFSNALNDLFNAIIPQFHIT